MAKSGTPRRRPEAPSAPTTLHEITRRYVATALALSRAMGLPCTETFMKEHRESITTCFIEAGRAGVRLAPAVQLPPLAAPPADATNGQAPAPEEVHPSNGHGATVQDARATDEDRPAPENGAVAPSPLTAADLPTRIPAGLQLPCAEALIADLRPAQLALLCGKVGLRALAEKSLAPLHVALLAERARRFEQGRTHAQPNGEG